MNGHGEKLSRKKETAIAALISTSTLAEAAENSSISESTLRRWLRDPNFSDRYEQERSRLLQSVVNGLRSKCAAAVEVLSAIAADGNSPASARRSAAKTIVELTLRAAELEIEQEVRDLTERLGALESKQCAL